jgi:hypothetical protein
VSVKVVLIFDSVFKKVGVEISLMTLKESYTSHQGRIYKKTGSLNLEADKKKINQQKAKKNNFAYMIFWHYKSVSGIGSLFRVPAASKIVKKQSCKPCKKIAQAKNISIIMSRVIRVEKNLSSSLLLTASLLLCVTIETENRLTA